MTPEQLAALRGQLPAFGERAQPSPLQQRFCHFYGIDFGAHQPHLEHTLGRLTSDQFTLAVHRWQQPGARANLLLVHGYFDHSGLFSKLIGWALSQRCNVLIFDLPGHGLSSGEPAVIDDFGDYGRAVSAVLHAASLPPLPWWVMAQSTGAAALIECARQQAGNASWPFAANVLLAPLVRPARWLGVSLAHRVLSPFLDGVQRGFAANSSDPDFLAFLQRDPLQSRRIPLRWIAALRRWLRDLPARDLGVGPALAIQGDADHTVDWRYNTRFMLRLFPASEVVYLHGAGHQLANESANYRCDYLGAVQRWLTRHGIELAALDVGSGVETR